MDASAAVPEVVDVADWRRCISELYARVRAADDPRAAWDFWRGERARLFQEHPASPLSEAERRRFTGHAYFDYDPKIRFAVDAVAPEDRTPLTTELDADGTVVLEPALRTSGLGEALGGELVIYHIAGYGGGLFLPFRDASSGAETFGGGRYVLDTIKGADLGLEDGRIVLDFNFAYNPSCAYAPRWSCPLAPPDNQLPVAVCGGERVH